MSRINESEILKRIGITDATTIEAAVKNCPVTLLPERLARILVYILEQQAAMNATLGDVKDCAACFQLLGRI